MSYRSREGGEDGENRFERPFRRDDRRERRPPRDFGDRPRFSYIRDLNVEREKLAKGEPLDSDAEPYERREYVPRDRWERRGSDEGRRFERRERGGDGDGRRFERRERSFDGEERRFERRERSFDGERRERRFDRTDDRRERRGGREEGQERRYEFRSGGDEEGRWFEYRTDGQERRGARDGRRFERDDRPERGRRRFEDGDRRERRPFGDEGRRSVYGKKKQVERQSKDEEEGDELRLNRFIAKGGVCSRRDADALIQAGRVKVNGEVVQQLGVKVKRTDKVEVDGSEVTPERKVYIVLNKPKDYVTTVDDPMERKTVMSLIEGACKERVYPVGRLDRQTTGVLLFTNDGDLAKKLTHPSYNQKKIYHVFLDKAVKTGDLEAIMEGVELEDGFVKADDVRVAEDDKTQVGIEIHSGKNRIVRRIFEHFGYQILRLDRVFFAGITKKNLPRGHWRFLTREEVSVLKTY